MSKFSYRQPAPPPLRLGDWLRREREARGLTLAAVAEGVGMDLSLVNKVEMGKRHLTEEQAAKLARLFTADPADIEARRVAEEIQHYYGDNPATPQALQILNDLPLGLASPGPVKSGQARSSPVKPDPTQSDPIRPSETRKRRPAQP